MSARVIGWDVGGANIKAVLIDQSHPRPKPIVIQRFFPLWREPHGLAAVLEEIAGVLGAADVMAVTMTAELADCFDTKREGVRSVLAAFESRFPDVEIWVYGVDGGFHRPEEAARVPLSVAAANWVAGATLTARSVPDAVFLDVGSTTTDVIPLVAGTVAARGGNDPERLAAGELVYTGALRTPVCAIVRGVPLKGRLCRVAAEHFAVAADVHRWLGAIEETDYTCETPDGRGRSRLESAARLARMVCADLEMLDEREITLIADHVARAQIRQIVGGLRQVRRRFGTQAPSTAVVAGSGAFLARGAAEELRLSVRELADQIGSEAAQAGPAAAVAYLLGEWRGDAFRR